MGAIKAIVDTLATAVKGIVEAATGTQGAQKMNLGDQSGQSDPAAQASNTLMDRQLAQMQSMQMQQMAQNAANQQNGNDSGRSFGGIRG